MKTERKKHMVCMKESKESGLFWVDCPYYRMEQDKHDRASKAEFVKSLVMEEFECTAEGLYSKVC